MAEIDWARMRELARELGFWPATTHPEDIERHRRLNKALDAAPEIASPACLAARRPGRVMRPMTRPTATAPPITVRGWVRV